MAVTVSRREERQLKRQQVTDRRPIRYWMALLISLLLVSAFTVGLSQHTLSTRLERSAAQESQPPLPLSALTSPEELYPALLALYPRGGDQQLVAQSLHSFLQAEGGPSRLTSLVSLRFARVPAELIDKTPDAPELKRALSVARRQAQEMKAEPPTEIPALSGNQLGILRLQLMVRTPEEVRGILWTSTLLVLLGFWLPLGVWYMRKLRPDPWLLPLVGALSGLGFTLMVSLRDPLRETLLFSDFATGIFVGSLLLTALSVVDLQTSELRRLKFLPLLGAVFLSLILLLFGKGPGKSDALVNLHLGPLVVQPVEAIKLLVVLFLAGYCASRWEQLRTLFTSSEQLPKLARLIRLPRLQDVWPVLAGMGIAIAFLFLQKDMGPALVLAWTFLALYSVARARGGLALLGIMLLVVACSLAYALETPSTIYRRITMLLHPWDNLLPGADQLALGLWSVAAGGATGAGLGWGETARVPAAHTDFILAAVAEELGFVGLLSVLVLYGLLFWRFLRIARRLEDSYAFFLVLGLLSLLTGQLFLIGAGVLGILPLSGVTTPLLSYGKSSQLAVFVMMGMVASLSGFADKYGASSAPGEGETQTGAAPFLGGMKVLAALGLLLLSSLAVRAADLQLRQADALMVTPLLTLQAGDELGFVPNPRLRALAERIPRGNILDRNGLPLATRGPDLLESSRPAITALGIDADQNCPERTRRCYPFGGMTFHLLGDLREPVNWSSSITDFAEKKYNVKLQGFDDKPEVVSLIHPRTGKPIKELKRDYSALLPAWWVHDDPSAPELKALLEPDRDLRLTLDMKVQVALVKALEDALDPAQKEEGEQDITRAAGVVMDAQTGAVLALANLPYPQQLGSSLRLLAPEDPALMDRARFGVYAPGSTFKLVTAMAALRVNPALVSKTYACTTLSDGRAGILLPGKSRPIRDDKKDKAHGNLSLRRGIEVSCNAYFAQLAVEGVKAGPLLQTAHFFGIKTSRKDKGDTREAERIKALDLYLAQAGFGQGEVEASPLEIATVAATIANGGRLVKPTFLASEALAFREQVQGRQDTLIGQGQLLPGDRVLTAADASLLATAMRDVVSTGTARRALGKLSIPVAGKTGTAEVEGKRSHAWFMGFAPYGETSELKLPGYEAPLAFAILVENAGYGGRYAAPVIGKVLEALLPPAPSPAETSNDKPIAPTKATPPKN